MLIRDGLLFACSALTLVTATGMSAALPSVLEGFAEKQGLTVDLMASQAQQVLTIPPLLFALCSPLWGFIADKIGKKPVLLAGLVGYVISGSAGLWLQTLGQVVVARGVLGACAGATMVASTALVADFYPALDQRKKMMGTQFSVLMGTGVCVLLLSGILAGISYRLPFAIYLYPALLIPAVFLWVHPLGQEDNEIKQVKSSSGVDEPSGNQGSPNDLEKDPEAKPGSSAASIPVGTSAAVNEEVDEVKVVDKGTVGDDEPPMTARRAYVMLMVCYGISFVAMGTNFALLVFAPFLIRELHPDLPPVISSIVISCWTLASAITSSQVFAKLQSRSGNVGVGLFVFACEAVGFALMALSPNWPIALVSAIIQGIGWGCYQPLAYSWATTVAPAEIRSRAVSGVNTSMFLGQYVTGLVFSPVETALGLSGVFWVGSGIWLLGAIGFTISGIVSRQRR